eukprot:TRINITY_DN3855_c0_g2_i16.p1 TRINITY_DN3855_c0_g2~~TRINITY_DN3855_c0_g2_i16.p1  ORF type:complete len:598 (-),score=114.17 TRINITY_DN3855_c0_g2_i16:1654-3270(-)
MANPQAIGTIDPGFRQNVFDVGIYSGQLTPDQRFSVPNGTDVSACQACVLSFETKEISGGASYVNTLSVNVEVNGKGWGAAFKGSYDYQKVEKGTSQYNQKFTKSTAVCEVYCAQIQTFTPPPLTNDFMKGVSVVLEKPYPSNIPLYQKFIKSFGTHVIMAVRMGGMFGEQSTFASDAWTKYLQSSSDISAEASASAFGASAAASTMTKEQQEQASNFQKQTLSRQIYTVGGSIPSDGQASTWASQAVAEPQVIKYELASLDELLDNNYFPNDPNIDQKAANLRLALSDYCNQTVLAGHLTNCQDPVDPTPAPPDLSFGGMFQVDDCNRNNVNNPLTNNIKCPNGYQTIATARIKAPESDCGAIQSYCVLSLTPLGSFGGFYQTQDHGEFSPFGNQMYGGRFACPPGYTSYQMERTKHPEYNEGSWLYICLAPFVPQKSQLGGFYQVNDDGSEDNVNNPFTGSRACPDGYRSWLYGRIKAPEGREAVVSTQSTFFFFFFFFFFPFNFFFFFFFGKKKGFFIRFLCHPSPSPPPFPPSI